MWKRIKIPIESLLSAIVLDNNFFDVNIACGIHPNIEIGKKSLKIPVSINILIKPETSDQPDREHAHCNVIIYSKVGWELLINNS